MCSKHLKVSKKCRHDRLSLLFLFILQELLYTGPYRRLITIPQPLQEPLRNKIGALHNL